MEKEEKTIAEPEIKLLEAYEEIHRALKSEASLAGLSLKEYTNQVLKDHLESKGHKFNEQG